MKLFRRLFLLLFSAALCAGCLSAHAWAAPALRSTILFTHDMHDHFLPVPDEESGESGGFTRLMTLLEQQRALNPNAVTLDAGDFSMGSLFQTIYATDAPELRAMGAMGYDAATFGNHEYDYRAQGFADMLSAAAGSGDPLPALVEANYKPPKEGEAGFDETDREVWDAMNRYGVSDYTVIRRGGIAYAIFGVMGLDSDACAPMSGMVLSDVAQSAQRVVEEIKTALDGQGEPYLIVCLSHSGTSQDKKKSEDELLAKAVPGIDVIISGHTHTTLEKPIQVGETLIVSSGAYTANLGVLTLEWEPGGKKSVAEYTLIPIDETVPEDPALSAMAENLKEKVNATYLENYGLTYDQILTVSDFDFTPISRFGERQEDDSLGDLIADSYIYAVKEAEGADYIPIDMAVVASGVIRGSFARGEITTSDVFNVSSLGSGADGTPGYPLISVWLTGRELKDAFEIDASVAPIMPTSQLYNAGMAYSFNPHRMLFNKVTSCAQVLEDGTEVPIEDDKLYRVVTGLYSGQMLATVNDQSFGLLTITPKDKDGKPVTNYESQIIHNPNGSEVKEWYALASYLNSFPKRQGISVLPEQYAVPAGRKTVAPSWNPVELLKNANWITLTALAVVLVVAAAAVLIVLKVRKKRRTVPEATAAPENPEDLDQTKRFRL